MPQATYKERRKSRRFLPKNGTMAANAHALGPVVNISMGGLCFHYIDNTLSQSLPDSIDMFLSSDNIYIDNIKIRIVSDKLSSQKTSFLFSKIILRECAIQFLNLTVAQKKELEEFILTKTQNIVN